MMGEDHIYMALFGKQHQIFFTFSYIPPHYLLHFFQKKKKKHIKSFTLYITSFTLYYYSNKKNTKK
jgi:hypothetical protein